MMLTRNTAQSLGLTDRTDAEQSLDGGMRYLQDMMAKVRRRSQKRSGSGFALAAYNMGYAHMLDAMALTKKKKQPNSWSDVKQRLPLLSQKPYYSRLKYGYARGHEATPTWKIFVSTISAWLDICLNRKESGAGDGDC